MKLALRLNLYRAADLAVPVDIVRARRAIGYHSVWTAEAYGADALSPLAYLAALTDRIKLGTAVAQLAARPPATLAMHAMTIDALAGGGRVIIGIGVSGPQIVEGWYGQPWGRPEPLACATTSTIMRKVLAREEPVTHDGPEISLPYRGPGSIGQGKPLKSIMHPVGAHPDLARVGWARRTPRCARSCPTAGCRWVSRRTGRRIASRSNRGCGTRGGRPADFEVFTGCSVQHHRRRRRRARPDAPAHRDVRRRDGQRVRTTTTATRWPAGVPRGGGRIQELWLAGRKDEAIAAVPDEYLEQTALSATSSASADAGLVDTAATGTTGLIVDAPGRRASSASLAELRDGR